MGDTNNVIENGNVRITSNYNFNNNVLVDKYERERVIERIADDILEKMNYDTTSRPFLCKVARKLSEATIWSNVEQALRSNRNPKGLFIYLCKRDGV